MNAEKKPRKKTGRPRIEFDQKVADRICEMISDGKSLRTICKLKLMPSRGVVNKWLREVPAFESHYARAHEEQADGYAEELMDLARQATAENAHAIRVRADIIKWVCSKLKPRKFGDRVGLDVQADVRHEAIDRDDPAFRLEIAKKVAFILTVAMQRPGTDPQASAPRPLALPAPKPEPAVERDVTPEPPRPAPGSDSHYLPDDDAKWSTPAEDGRAANYFSPYVVRGGRRPR